MICRRTRPPRYSSANPLFASLSTDPLEVNVLFWSDDIVPCPGTVHISDVFSTAVDSSFRFLLYLPPICPKILFFYENASGILSGILPLEFPASSEPLRAFDLLTSLFLVMPRLTCLRFFCDQYEAF